MDDDDYYDSDDSEWHREHMLHRANGEEQEWLRNVARMREGCSYTTSLHGKGEFICIQEMTDEDWEQLGRDISSSRHLESFYLTDGALNDHIVPFFFRGLTRRSSFRTMNCVRNAIGIAGARSMVPFLQNANTLTLLDLSENNIQSEGFNVLFRALRDSPVRLLYCAGCGIESIDIDTERTPRNLKHLVLERNNITIDGCRGLAKLLQGGDATLERLYLDRNEIDDNGVEILSTALQMNKSLKYLSLMENGGISGQGLTLLLKLVNNISSIEETLRSNHTLGTIDFSSRTLSTIYISGNSSKPILLGPLIGDALWVNGRHANDPEGAGRQKIIQTQLHSQTRADLCRLQGVDHCVFSEIDPLHLPEVLSLIGKKHGQGELYVALLSSIMPLFSTINREGCIEQEKEYHAAKAAEYEAIAAEHRAKEVELENELAAMRDSAGVTKDTVASQSSKRRRT